MERIGVCVISYGAREAAMIDAFMRSEYEVQLFVVDKQENPFNVKMTRRSEGVHRVDPKLNVEEIVNFVGKYRDKIDLVIPGCESPIINGLRDRIQREFNYDIPVLCPEVKYALEKSKVEQRLLLEEVVPEVNPRFRVFDPNDYKKRSEKELEKDIERWMSELGGIEHSVIKPDKPGFGKGVGVGGEHFLTLQQALDHFYSVWLNGKEKVIIEKKLDGEESSFQAFCDGTHLVPLPETRDYKRAFDGDKGPNTGGMGSYKDVGNYLPFMNKQDWEKEIEIVNKIFDYLKSWHKEIYGDEKVVGLIGMPFYVAFIHTEDGPKILEINSRPGDPEIINLLPIMKDDFVDVCFKLMGGFLTRLEFEPKATVVTYAVPEPYPAKDGRKRKVDLSAAYRLMEEYGEERMRIYPASMEMNDDGNMYALGSRTVCVVGIGDSLHEAREISLKGIKAIVTRSEGLRYRTDVASRGHINKSIEHMKELRGY